MNVPFYAATTISAAAAALPQVKGRGTLADLRVAMTLDPALVATVQTILAPSGRTPIRVSQ